MIQEIHKQVRATPSLHEQFHHPWCGNESREQIEKGAWKLEVAARGEFHVKEGAWILWPGANNSTILNSGRGLVVTVRNLREKRCGRFENKDRPSLQPS